MLRNLKQQKTMINLATGVMCLFWVGVVSRTLFITTSGSTGENGQVNRLSVQQSSPVNFRTDVSVDSKETRGSSENSWDPKIFQRAFQRPLYDPPPRKIEAAPPPPPINLSMVGSVLREGGASRVILRLASGQMHWAVEGDTVENATVLKIEADQVLVRFHDEERLITKK